VALQIRLLGGVVKRILSLQSSPYLLQIDKRVLVSPIVVKNLVNGRRTHLSIVICVLQDQVCSFLQYPDADTCFNRSLKIEPRIPTS
jgi:hypothetical protein